MKLDPRLAPLVRARTGLAIADDMLGRAIRQRLRERQEGDAEAYMARILDDEGEFADLLDLLVIPETWFFRDPQAIAHAARFAQERHARSGAPVRLLSLPCSTGEEPYTLAMALFDTGLPAQAFQVTAVDINEPSLERARRGLYGRNSFRARDLGFRDRYFDAEGDRQRLAERVRNQVRFRQGNILQLGSLRDGAPFDVVLCRNLLIYFDDQTQGRALSHLAALMHDDGLLCVGSSEMVSAMRHGFASLGVAHASALVKRQAAVADPARPHPPAAAPRRKAAVRTPPPAPALPARLRARRTPPGRRRAWRRSRGAVARPARGGSQPGRCPLPAGADPARRPRRRSRAGAAPGPLPGAGALSRPLSPGADLRKSRPSRRSRPPARASRAHPDPRR